MGKRKEFMEGVKSGIPIGLGYVSVSFTFGLIAITYGLTWWQAVLISMTTVTSAGQFAGIDLMRQMGAYLEMLISQLVINVRYSFMSISLSQKTEKKFQGIYRWLLGFFVTDEIFAVASAKEEVSVAFFSGLAVVPYLGWTLGTLVGALIGNVLPHRLMSAFGVAIYGMFVAIVVPQMKQEKPVIFVAGLAAVLSCLFRYVPALFKASGLAVSICAVISAAIGATVFPKKQEE